MERLILGTAGHIDHGKTTLVRALTGIDTDRLPEEKRRGITIDLGFAALDLPDGTRYGIVDVPGHEAFVRNMLAGASGVDVALLVVAADEGVMPQTREHLAILELLAVPALVVALTKADLVDEEWRELAIDDVRGLLAHSRWPAAPMLSVSGATGQGLDALRATLAQAAHAARARRRDDLFRLPVDRVFTVHGTGTVVTGSVWSGTVRRDDPLRLLPSGTMVRVRGVHTHGTLADQAAAGERAALALAGIERAAIDRGDTLLGGAGWSASHNLTVRCTVLADAERPVRARQRVRVHLGTAEVMARVALPGGGEIAPGHSAWAQLRLERPLVARARDRAIIRSYSPVTTIAGVVVAEPDAPRRPRIDAPTATALAAILEGDAAAAVGACAALHAWQGVAPDALPTCTGLPPALTESVLLARGSLCVTSSRVFPASVLDTAAAALRHAIDDWHAGAPLEPGCERDVLRRALPRGAHAELLHAAIDRLLAEGTITVSGATYARTGWEPVLSPAQEALREHARATYRQAGLAAPTTAELPPSLSASPDCAALLRLLERNGELVTLESGRYVSREALHSGIEAARHALAGRDDLGPADFRELWGLTRKHLIPLLEYLDRTGVTERKGDLRRMARGG